MRQCFHSFFYFFILISFALFQSACKGYPSRIGESIRLVKLGQPLKSAQLIEKKALKDGKDQLVYLLNYATFLQIAHEYSKSTKAFLKAESLSEVKDYYSLSRISGSILLNEGLVQYKGDDYEKLLINVMLAINFLMEGKTEAALVETRKLNEKLYRYNYEGKKKYEQNVFAYYLAALIWEMDQKWDDAYLDYKKAYALNPSFSYLEGDLIRLSALSQNWEQHEKWKKEFNLHFKSLWKNPYWKDPSFGELVFIFQQGWGPKKRPHPQFYKIPKLFPRFSLIKKSLIEVYQPKKSKDGSSFLEPVLSKQTEFIYSVQDVAIKTLDDKYKILFAKRAAGILTKELVSHEVRKKNEVLGSLLNFSLHLVDQADLRQWSTLPKSFQMLRIPLKKGRYKIRVYYLDRHGNRSFSFSKDIEILPKRKYILHNRSTR